MVFIDGLSLGLSFGLLVGGYSWATSRILVGLLVGPEVGPLEGRTAGLVVGSFVGLLVVIVEEKTVGLVVGSFEGNIWLCSRVACWNLSRTPGWTDSQICCEIDIRRRGCSRARSWTVIDSDWVDPKEHWAMTVIHLADMMVHCTMKESDSADLKEHWIMKVFD